MSICVFLSIAGNRRYIKVFKLLIYLGIRAYLTVLPKGLYYRNLLLLKGPFYLKATAFYREVVTRFYRRNSKYK